MKIKKSELKRIIQEELEAALDEFMGLPKWGGLSKRLQGDTLANKTAEEASILLRPENVNEY